MKLYDGTSTVSWFYDGEKTADEMKDEPRYSRLFSCPCVLYDNGVGKVYDFEPLQDVCSRLAVAYTADVNETYTNVCAKLDGTYKADGVEEVEQIATAAQDAAKKAQAQAEQAAAGSNPELATFATMQLTSLSPTMSDMDAMSIPSLFPEWKVGAEYEARQVIRYEGELYRIAQEHTAQEQYKPGTGTESLYAHITQSSGYDVWQQPSGAHDAYQKGTRVWYPTANSALFESLIDGNTWSPDEYPQGWRKVA
ncbi:carbohydrate-binding protein [Collinsella tanakaei]|uniref:carbohydrate-binding protein n=1 Tax=Collinsella tanakaei TaxID=626935 RepID=UPI00241EDE21|nr:carbohydrate-binding protein [Collinsella tanakaei]